MISNLRLFGILLGGIGIVEAFLHFRGANWRRKPFLFFFLLSLGLLVVSVSPELVNSVSELLMLKDSQHGRILTLLMLSSLSLWCLIIYYYEKIEKLKYNTDQLFRAMTIAESKRQHHDILNRLKPVTILIPAYNEADNLRELLPRLPKTLHGLEVCALVVDDGSSDETPQVLAEQKVLYVRHMINRGQGAASRLGYNLLRMGGVQIGVTMDADNQHRPEDLPKLVDAVLNGGYDLVIGSRRLGSGETSSRARNLGIILFSWVLSMVTALRLTDCTSGFKAVSRRWLDQVILREDQFQSTEVLISTVKKGLRVSEVPVTIAPRQFGTSKKGTDFAYGCRVAKVIIKAWWRK